MPNQSYGSFLNIYESSIDLVEFNIKHPLLSYNSYTPLSLSWQRNRLYIYPDSYLRNDPLYFSEFPAPGIPLLIRIWFFLLPTSAVALVFPRSRRRSILSRYIIVRVCDMDPEYGYIYNFVVLCKCGEIFPPFTIG